jgi:DNA uptake protein ComE-like DNA-binding protein
MNRQTLSRNLLLTAMTLAISFGALSQTSIAQVGKNMGILNPNLATEVELRAISGLSGQLVDGILEQRPFLTMAAFDAYLGMSLSEDQRTALYEGLFLPINLNNATDREILAIPRAGNRMLREFKEYRPYAALAQFRREIGKYVDDDEVARLEQYVFVPVKLNTASDEDILTIPGIGSRMLREFKEYRPYSQIEQFRREMGKYVDDDEVARMERYVTVD